MSYKPEAICVYVIEDDASVRTSLSRLLRASGMEVAIFTSMANFRDTARRVQRSCLLIDIGTLSSGAVTDMVQAQSVKTLPPMIAISDCDDAISRNKAHELGAKFLLHKPLDGQALIDAVHWVMDVHEASQGCTI